MGIEQANRAVGSRGRHEGPVGAEGDFVDPLRLPGEQRDPPSATPGHDLHTPSPIERHDPGTSGIEVHQPAADDAPSFARSSAAGWWTSIPLVPGSKSTNQPPTIVRRTARRRQSTILT